MHEDPAVTLTSYPGTVRQLIVTGLGRQEPTAVIALGRCHIDWAEGLLVVRDSKFGKSREVVLDQTRTRPRWEPSPPCARFRVLRPASPAFTREPCLHLWTSSGSLTVPDQPPSVSNS